MSKAKPFPAIHGGCYCGSTRYRLETAPLFCHACHCQDCNKQTGSVFASFTTIEAEFVSSIGKTPPQIVTTRRPGGNLRHQAACRTCGTKLWSVGDGTPLTADILSGTLDLPELMEPDVHAFIEAKISWVILPEGAKTCRGPFDFRKHWPKSSMKRLEAAVLRAQARQRAIKVAGDAGVVVEGVDVDDEKEADKTPTASTPDEKEDAVEDDEEFERRYRETEKALQERLEQLSLKLNENESVQEDDLRPGVVDKTKELSFVTEAQPSTADVPKS